MPKKFSQFFDNKTKRRKAHRYHIYLSYTYLGYTPNYIDYQFKLTEGDTLVRRARPCRKCDGV